MELFESQIGIPDGLKKIDKSERVSTGETFIKPRIIGGIFEGGSFRTASSGARVEIFPIYDTAIGIISYDDDGVQVFATKILGDDIGDVTIGNYDGDQGAKWDKSAGVFAVKGEITAYSGTIGGFNLGVDHIKDVANSFGLTSVVTVGDDIRFWAGSTFANRASAPFRVTEAGAVTASSLTITGGDVTYSTLTGITSARLLGRTTAGVGDVEQITAGTGLTLSAGALSVSITQYTDALARAAISETITGIGYSSSTGVFSLTSGYVIPTTADESNWDSAYGWGDHSSEGYLLNTSGLALLSSTGSINAKTVATTNLYTVPVGKTMIPTMAVIRVTTATDITVVPTLGIGVAAGEADIFAPVALTGLDATTKIWTFITSGLSVKVVAEAIIKLGIDVGATATTMTISVDLFGYLY
jgi:hypothetical protein